MERIAAVRRQRDVPREIRALVPDHDYVDLFCAPVPAAADAPPEAWARATVEGAPPLGRSLAWRVACGLRLDERPENVGGWAVAGCGENWIVLATPGVFMSARMVFWVDDAEVSFATFMRYDRRIARSIWWGVSHVHRAVAPAFLAGGVRRLECRRTVG